VHSFFHSFIWIALLSRHNQQTKIPESESTAIPQGNYTSSFTTKGNKGFLTTGATDNNNHKKISRP